MEKSGKGSFFTFNFWGGEEVVRMILAKLYILYWVTGDIEHASTLPETNSLPLKIGPSQKERIIFQPSIFRCDMLVSGRVCPIVMMEMLKNYSNIFNNICQKKSELNAKLGGIISHHREALEVDGFR